MQKKHVKELDTKKTKFEGLAILFLGSQMATGGAQKLLLSQSRWFNEKGYRVAAAFFYDKEGLYKQWQAESPFPLINLDAWQTGPGIKKITRLLSGLWRLFHLMQKERFQIVLTYTHHANLLGLPIAWINGTSVRVASHHGQIEEFPPALEYAHSFMINRGIAERLVTVSREVNEQALKEGVLPERLVIIANGIESSFRVTLNQSQISALREEIGIPEDTYMALTVGRLRSHKGHTYLLDAIPCVLKALPNTIFVIAGDGPLRDTLEAKFKSLNIENNVRFLGERDDIPQLHCIADIFVLPSVSEGMPIALLEAMISSVPVITTRVAGIDELIDDGKTGITVPPADPDALCRAVVKLLPDPQLRSRLAEGGKKHVEKHYTVDSMCEKYEKLFNHLLSEKG